MLMWIIYVVLVSALLGLAALAAERRAHLRHKASRWYWLLAIVTSLLLPTVISSVSIQLPNVFGPTVSDEIIALREVTSSRLSPTLFISNHWEHHTEHRKYDAVITWAWAALSTLLLCALLASGAYLLWRKRRWEPMTLLNTSVLLTDNVGPAVVGLINPTIVIPTWIIDSPVAHQQAVITHEQSHLDAGDPLLLTIALSLLVFMPWNLPLWWQVRRLRCAIEVDCDARVLRSGQSITSYGETLIAVGQRYSQYVGSVAGMSESASFLEKRINIMLSKPAKWWRISAIAFGFASVCLVAIAAQVSPPNAMDKPATNSREISLAPDLLDNYTGTYKLYETGIITITRDGTRLLSQLTGQPSLEIYPTSTTEFFYKVVDAQIIFSLDEQGYATALTLQQNGASMIAPRIDSAAAGQINNLITNKIQNQTPTPGSEDALRKLIADIVAGKPDYSTMSAELAQATRDQLTSLQTGIKSLGEIKSVTFRGVGNQGWDSYEVQHENGVADWRILMSEDGRILGTTISVGP